MKDSRWYEIVMSWAYGRIPEWVQPITNEQLEHHYGPTGSRNLCSWDAALLARIKEQEEEIDDLRLMLHRGHGYITNIPMKFTKEEYQDVNEWCASTSLLLSKGDPDEVAE